MTVVIVGAPVMVGEVFPRMSRRMHASHRPCSPPVVPDLQSVRRVHVKDRTEIAPFEATGLEILVQHDDIGGLKITNSRLPVVPTEV
jgi:hypothetical protein